MSRLPRCVVRASLLALTLLVGACSSRPNAPGDVGVSGRIADQVERGDGTEVDLAALAPFEWTRFCAFGPYTTQEVAETSLGFDWPYAWSQVELLDDRSYLVFVNGRTVVSAFDHSRGLGGFAQTDPTCFARRDARFTVREDGRRSDGRPHSVLRASR